MTSTAAPARQLPWDAMGSGLKSDAPDVATALKEAGLDYTVEVRQAVSGGWCPPADAAAGSALLKNRKTLTAPGHQALVRPMPDGTEKVLAFTRTRYTPIQNVSAFAVADDLVTNFGAKIIGAADFRNGDRSLLAVDLAEPVRLTRPDGGEDRVDLDLVIVNDHAGNAALTLALTPVRFACTNALPAAMREAERAWKISHTPRAQVRLDLAADAIKRAADYRGAFQAQAQAMLDQPMVDAEFAKLVAKLYPTKGKGDRAQESAKAIQQQLRDAWKTSATLDGIQGTRWAGYNVVTEYLDHHRPVRGEAGPARAEGALDGLYVRRKAALWGMFAAA